MSGNAGRCYRACFGTDCYHHTGALSKQSEWDTVIGRGEYLENSDCCMRKEACSKLCGKLCCNTGPDYPGFPVNSNLSDKCKEIPGYENDSVDWLDSL